MKFYKITYSLVFFSIVGCSSSQIQTGLQLTSQAFGLNANATDQTISNTQTNNIFKISEAQKNQIINQINFSESNEKGNLKIAIKESKSMIYNVVSSISCSPEHQLPNNLTQFVFPQTYPFSSFDVPLSRIGLKKNECTTVKSINNWEMNENGEIKFTVIYIANDTEQTLRTHYFIKKQQASGKWLFYRSYIS